MKVKSITRSRPSEAFVDAQWVYSSEPKDTSKPLPYLRYGNVSPTRNSQKALDDLTGNGYGLSNPVIARAYAKAYDKFVDQAKQGLSIQMGANLAESKQTLEMIANRGGQLLELARSLRRGKIPPWLRKKSLKRKVSGRGWAQVPGGWWLEYHFAWSPLLDDIHTGMQMLSNPVWDLTPITARGSSSERIDRSNPRDWRFATVDVSSINAFVGIRGNARVTNKNAYLLNRMGLINPASVAWEVIPFSFAIDWFLPVSSFLSSYTDQVGWSVDRLHISMKDTCGNTWIIQNEWDTPENNVRISSAYRFQRDLSGSLPIPGLFDRRGTGIKSLTRGATAIALLVGFLRKNP